MGPDRLLQVIEPGHEFLVRGEHLAELDKGSYDKDFGEKVFRSGKAHAGVVLLRLKDERPGPKIQVISRLLELYADKLQGSFIVVSEQRIKIGKRRQ